jgi:hypothetical protein
MLSPGNALRYHYVDRIGSFATQCKASGGDDERQEKSMAAQTSLLYWR